VAAPLDPRRLLLGQRADEAAAVSLAARLDQLSASLPPHERAILVAMVEAAMPPHDRLAQRAPGDVLDENELRTFNELLAQGERPQREEGR
jgi:hypothetical protein